MSPPDRNAIWAGAFAEELARAGVSQLCVAPGSRSTPLVLACARLGAFRMRVHLDERSAGFFALGIGKATGVPAVVLTTSGTAAANLLPAVIEASLSESPLLVITADRPHRLRGADANQTIDQVRLYGTFTREFHDVPAAAVDGPALRHLRALASRAVAAAVGLPAGPVHLNFPFDEPLTPPPEGGDDANDPFADTHPRSASGRPRGRAYVGIGPRRPILDEREIDALSASIAKSRRPLLVAGPHPEPDRLGAAATRFARVTGIPVIADPLSGVRFGPHEGACVYGSYEIFLQEPDVRADLAPDLILRVGRTPASAALVAYLQDGALDAHVLIDPSHLWKDHLAVATQVLRGDASHALAALADREWRQERDSEWCGRWTRLEEAVTVALAEPLAAGEADARFEGMVAHAVVRATPKDATLFVSNSMPVRDLDAFGGMRTEPLRVLGNRGASGIDGIVSTSLGVAAGGDQPVVVLLGDIALLHDANGLLAAREPDVQVVFVVVNNDGGGIFHFLPVREHEPHFTPFFATPHGVQPQRLAALYGVPWECVGPADLEGSLRHALDSGGSHVIEVVTDRETNRRQREAAVQLARAAARAALEQH